MPIFKANLQKAKQSFATAIGTRDQNTRESVQYKFCSGLYSKEIGEVTFEEVKEEI